jgi:integrase/recombinase XerD
MRGRGQRRPRRRSPGSPSSSAESDPEDLGARLRGFAEYQRVRHYSEHTVATQLFQLEPFIEWCQERGLRWPSEVTRPVLERYQRHLFHWRKTNGRPLSFSTQKGRLMAVRAFFRWLARQHHIAYNPASELELPRTEHRLPQHVLTVQEAEQVIAQADVEEALGLRDRAILETLYSTGMRRMEVCGLSLYDLDVERGTVIVRQGKGRKDRVIPIGERATAWIERYLAEVRPSLVVEPDAGVLFLSADGEALSPDHLTGRVSRYVAAARVGKKGSCHLFRHTMATLMLEGGADVRYIQQMLGHRSLETTEIYTHVSIRNLKAIHTATHPASLERRRSASATLPVEEAESDEPAERAELLVDLDAERRAGDD